MIMKKYSGYSLIELMVALVVLGILLAVGAPQMGVFFKGNRMVANANDLLGGLYLARSEAIKRNSRVTICRSENAGDAIPTCSSSAAGWEKGWFVYVDVAGIGTYSKGVDGDVLRVNTGAEGESDNQVTITASDIGIDKFVSFTSRGIPKQNNGATQSGVFRICDPRGLTNTAGGVVARGVVLNAAGRVRTTKDAAKIGTCP